VNLSGRQIRSHPVRVNTHSFGHSTFILSCSCYLHACACGFFGDASRECRCTPATIQRYLGKISGPLLDRIDIHVEVPAVSYKDMREGPSAESSAEIRVRVLRARERQMARGFTNATMPSRLIRKLCTLDEAGERTLEMAVRRLGLSARAHDRILRVSRTIADLGEADNIAAKHIAEGIQYRSLDRNYWN
jgi:magnesium chelatase family protein